MSLEQMFTLANMIAMLGWLVLLMSPLIPVGAEWISGRLIPVLLSVVYTALILVFWGQGDGGFSSLPEVMKLFTQPELVLVGWVHYLAFDLFIGAWECRTARAERIRFWFVVLCLALTFMFGPIGLLLFTVIRIINKQTSSSALAI